MKVHSVVVCLATFIQLCCAQTDGRPRSETSDYGKLFIDAVNAESEPEQIATVHRVFSTEAVAKAGVDKFIGLFKRLRADFAPLEFHHSEVVPPSRPGRNAVMHVFARKKNGPLWHDFQFLMEAPPSRQIVTLAFIAEVSEPVFLPNGSIDQPETMNWLSTYIKKLNDENDLSGSLLIAKGNDVLIEKYFGLADRLRDQAVDPGTLFNLGSGNKMFTALGIAKLAEEGRLDYQDKVTKYVSGFADDKKAEKMTIHHLLSHTSGIAEYWSGQTDDAIARCTTIREHLPFVYRAGFDFEPGSEYRYCNSNYILLGAIIEKVTGMDYYDYIQETIYKPAGMLTSGSFFYADTSKRMARPYSRKDDTWIESPHKARGSSTGGGYSNGRDMLRFSEALKHNRILKATTFQAMIEPKNAEMKSVSEDYGYGFIITKTRFETAYGHGGTARGINFEFRYFPKQDITFIVFCNQDNGAYDDLKKNAVKLITGQR